MVAANNTRFGTAPDGSAVTRVTIARAGTTAHLLTWGARVQDMRIAGVPYPLVLGGTDMAAYTGPMEYYGAIVGPVANRVAEAAFTLNGQTHRLDPNEKGITTLHGGAEGFATRNWALADQTDDSVTFTLQHADGHCGFPGNIAVRATYALDPQGALVLTITGTTDRPTYFSPAFHGYWNLTGAPAIADHIMTIRADTYLPVDERGIPLGAPADVAGTIFDFREGAALDSGKVDHNFCIAPGTGPVCTVAAGGLVLTIEADLPGLQVYDAGRNDTSPHAGLQGTPYGPLSGVALEPQYWPDTPNHPDYPQSLLHPGETYSHTARFHVARG